MIIRFLYRAYLGLLGIVGLGFKFINTMLTNKALKIVFDEKEPTTENIKKAMRIQTFGVGEDEVPELYTLPAIYANFKLIRLLLKLHLGKNERDELREYFFFKKQYSILLRKKFGKKDFSLELELYTHLYKNNLF